MPDGRAGTHERDRGTRARAAGQRRRAANMHACVRLRAALEVDACAVDDSVAPGERLRERRRIIDGPARTHVACPPRGIAVVLGAER